MKLVNLNPMKELVLKVLKLTDSMTPTLSALMSSGVYIKVKPTPSGASINNFLFQTLDGDKIKMK